MSLCIFVKRAVGRPATSLNMFFFFKLICVLKQFLYIIIFPFASKIAIFVIG